jgi:hypothetical protein
VIVAAACQEPNPDFDGAATSSNDTGPAATSTETGPDTNATSTGPVATGDGTTGTSSGEPPGTSSGEPGTSSGAPGDSTTEACMGMMCQGECVDTQTDDDNCGMCNNKCMGIQQCIDGECMMP